MESHVARLYGASTHHDLDNSCFPAGLKVKGRKICWVPVFSLDRRVCESDRERDPMRNESLLGPEFLKDVQCGV